ncbi:MAG TPA: D-2-hydroxyacid dehydrogenase [Candidatus Angelobacter sp.]|nr:D-2-hydroxyacid dehydrogenase [Candidatus Angelobacter sp.]
MKIVSTAQLREELREDLSQSFPEVSFEYYKSMKDAEHALDQAEVLITYGEDLTETEINKSTQLKWIMVISAGLEKMPLKLIKEKDIIVTNARGIHRVPMAEYTFTMLLHVAKNAKMWLENQSKAIWDRRIKMEELHDQTLALIGPGAIGSEIARLAKAFGMTTIGVNTKGTPVDYIDVIYKIDDLLQAVQNAKYVVSILPETADTYKILDSKFFEAMRNDAVFVNIGRGKTVDQSSMLIALQNNQIQHAVLDVFEEEPLPNDHPFWKMDNVTVSPHFSSVTEGYQPRALEIFKKNLSNYIKGSNDWINLIDLDRGY